jgi:hypothetical protein
VVRAMNVQMVVVLAGACWPARGAPSRGRANARDGQLASRFQPPSLGWDGWRQDGRLEQPRSRHAAARARSDEPLAARRRLGGRRQTCLTYRSTRTREPRASERGRSAQLHRAASASVAAPRQPGCQEGRRIDAEEIEPASAEAHPRVLRASSWTTDATRWSRSARLAHHGVSMHVAPERSGRPDAASAVAPRTETLEFEVDHRGWRPSRAKLGTVGLARGDEARGGAWQGLRLA